jgi:hypothetical protein
MKSVAISSVTHEQGWGSLFSVNFDGRDYGFCVSALTLQATGLRQRTKATFPQTFEANMKTLLQVAQMLIEAGRLEGAPSFGGTEILPEHILEIQNA